VSGLVEAGDDGDSGTFAGVVTVRLRDVREKWGFAKVEVPERWNGCLLVNPLCPDDLCWLPAEPGHNHIWHCLGTMPWDQRITIGGSAFYMSKTAVTERDLIKEGAEKQWELFGDWHDDGTVSGPGLIHPKPAKFRTRRPRRSAQGEDASKPADAGTALEKLQRRLAVLVRGEPEQQ